MHDQTKARVSRSRDVNMFGELSHTNRILLENARERRDGYLCEIMSCLVFSAFKYEAFINHIGIRLVPNWHERERDRHADKQKAIFDRLGLVPEKGRRPYQTLHDLFEVRNALAHGKPMSLAPPPVVEAGTREELRRRRPLTSWETRCTLEFAELAYEDTEKIAESLWKSAGFDLSELRSRGHSYSISEVGLIPTSTRQRASESGR